jgi:hypothetical protein
MVPVRICNEVEEEGKNDDMKKGILRMRDSP